jgi:dihydroneopterin aldolase
MLQLEKFQGLMLKDCPELGGYMDKIIIKNAGFYGYHGVLPEEREKGQHFYIDVEMGVNFAKAVETDDLEQTVDYSSVFYLIGEIVERRKFLLIEKLAGVIAYEILEKFSKVEELTVRVRKPEAPIKGSFDWTEVVVSRCRNEK